MECVHCTLCTSHVYPQRAARFGQHDARRATQCLAACTMQTRGSKVNPLRICCNELFAQPRRAQWAPQGLRDQRYVVHACCMFNNMACPRTALERHCAQPHFAQRFVTCLARQQQTLQAPLARPGAFTLPLALAGARSPAYTSASRAPLQGRSCAWLTSRLS